MANFEIGDVVRLRSGGPKMTVCKRDIGLVECCWFAESPVPVMGYQFSPDMLEFADDEFYEDEDLANIELDALMAESRYYSDGH